MLLKPLILAITVAENGDNFDKASFGDRLRRLSTATVASGRGLRVSMLVSLLGMVFLNNLKQNDNFLDLVIWIFVCTLQWLKLM